MRSSDPLLRVCVCVLEKMTPFTAIDNGKTAFAALLTTTKGAKQLPALYADGSTVVFQSDEFHEVQFEPIAFGDS